MLRKIHELLHFRHQEETIHTPKIEQNMRIYCVGDIHGRYDLLLQLHALITEDIRGYHGKLIIVYLGDYIDRGEDSKQVIEHLISHPLSHFNPVFLLGNHEQTLLKFLYNPDLSQIPPWFSFGGLSTLMSYDINVNNSSFSPQQLAQLHADFKNNLPAEHLKFFQQLKPYFQQNDYYFVHAGVNPTLKLKQQHREDLLWIREPFLESQRCHGKVIVHGHSVSSEPVVLPNRIGIDTGAYYSNKLSCAVFEDSNVRFLST